MHGPNWHFSLAFGLVRQRRYEASTNFTCLCRDAVLVNVCSKDPRHGRSRLEDRVREDRADVKELEAILPVHGEFFDELLILIPCYFVEA